ncbi:hypothetical protein L1987_63736 [Smallanthus sonchifolius]|uniref:Uncharacterized protein n=1 Tax=Smallanthus sonchifolius TaxID=185202 RepID=A0ACB9CE42_9ASTR|nr:hypothetical protein L1987_63736 [Smallanthus sonchifolius]
MYIRYSSRIRFTSFTTGFTGTLIEAISCTLPSPLALSFRTTRRPLFCLLPSNSSFTWEIHSVHGYVRYDCCFFRLFGTRYQGENMGRGHSVYLLAMTRNSNHIKAFGSVRKVIEVERFNFVDLD